MAVTDEVDPLAHEPDGDEAFADNMALYWVDRDRGLAGVLAFGVWPNRGDRGKGITWFAIHDATTGVIVQRTTPPTDLVDGDRTAGRLGAGDVHHEIGSDGVHRVVAVDAPTGTEVALDLEDFFPLTPHPVAADDPVLAVLAARHRETAGRATGVVRIDGRTVDVHALYVRDRSWGPRHDVPISSYHWSVGTCGPDLMWSAMSTTVAGMPIMKTGFAIVDGSVLPLTARSAFTVDEDALTVLAWRTVGALGDGRAFAAEVREPRAHLLDHRTWPAIVATDTLGAADVTVAGTSRSGVAALNMVVNPRLGTQRPARYDGGSVTDGRSVQDAAPR